MAKAIEVSKKEPQRERGIVNCQEINWQQLLHSHLFKGREVDLINFEYETHGHSCELIAQAFAMQFQLDRVPAAKAAHFRRRPEWNGTVSSAVTEPFPDR